MPKKNWIFKIITKQNKKISIVLEYRYDYTKKKPKKVFKTTITITVTTNNSKLHQRVVCRCVASTKATD